MKPEKETSKSIPLHDYSPAVNGAVSWLGDRYLLAEPVQKRPKDRKSFFHQTTAWHPARA